MLLFMGLPKVVQILDPFLTSFVALVHVAALELIMQNGLSLSPPLLSFVYN